MRVLPSALEAEGPAVLATMVDLILGGSTVDETEDEELERLWPAEVRA